jgi:hypothetical protein
MPCGVQSLLCGFDFRYEEISKVQARGGKNTGLIFPAFIAFASCRSRISGRNFQSNCIK